MRSQVVVVMVVEVVVPRRQGERGLVVMLEEVVHAGRSSCRGRGACTLSSWLALTVSRLPSFHHLAGGSRRSFIHSLSQVWSSLQWLYCSPAPLSSSRRRVEGASCQALEGGAPLCIAGKLVQGHRMT